MQRRWSLMFEVWSFFGIWDLEFGISRLGFTPLASDLLHIVFPIFTTPVPSTPQWLNTNSLALSNDQKTSLSPCSGLPSAAISGLSLAISGSVVLRPKQRR